MTSRIVAFDHVQLAMPRGREDDAERFYAGVTVTLSDEIAGTTRGHIEDCFGNRIELVAET